MKSRFYHGVGRPPEDPLTRIMRRVKKKDGCWLYPGANNNGYPTIRVWGKSVYVYRYMYELRVGIIPSDLEVDHLCEHRNCVNPAHLEAVTSKVNCERRNTPRDRFGQYMMKGPQDDGSNS